MTDRIRLDDLTSADLDELYRRLEAAEATIARIQAACDELHHQVARRFDDTSNGNADARRRILHALTATPTP
ncbi:hypothetical protein IPZ58_07715 [Streptomyces roseoverticillatus]|uniref:hypothetical protein n=1 Tax=Streptomyces roseoverticillatus TaxID=66429 RepID=UPI001F26E07D|nr:hypothetical protein [Streptomyces roseoverticillatus]MCF3101466.1 hypothetical protein [Streptomyces roseoverticillatus]